MKKRYTFKTLPSIIIAFHLFIHNCHAAIHIVTVANFQFTPAQLSFPAGDTIQWQWNSGSHTTTSVSIPAGAATWDHNINSGSTSFTYIPTVTGTYNYHCTPHAPM